MKQDSLIHIAFADDHKIIREGIVSLLKTIGGIAVDIQADHGQDLLDQLEKANVLPHICMIDINMPVMDGFTLIAEIKKRWPDMKVLVLTTFNYELYIIRMVLAGANGYLIKNCDIDELKQALVTIRTDGDYFSECANSTLFHLVKTKAIKLQSFTDREIEFLKYCASELSYSQIAEKMGIKLASVQTYRDRLFAKLNLNSRVELVIFAVRFGIVLIEHQYKSGTIIPVKKSK